MSKRLESTLEELNCEESLHNEDCSCKTCTPPRFTDVDAEVHVAKTTRLSFRTAAQKRKLSLKPVYTLLLTYLRLRIIQPSNTSQFLSAVAKKIMRTQPQLVTLGICSSHFNMDCLNSSLNSSVESDDSSFMTSGTQEEANTLLECVRTSLESYLNSSAPHGFWYLFSHANDTPHLHFVHACSYSNKSCRCGPLTAIHRNYKRDGRRRKYNRRVVRRGSPVHLKHYLSNLQHYSTLEGRVRIAASVDGHAWRYSGADSDDALPSGQKPEAKSKNKHQQHSSGKKLTNNNNSNNHNFNMTGTRIKPGMELYKPPSGRNERTRDVSKENLALRPRAHERHLSHSRYRCHVCQDFSEFRKCEKEELKEEVKALTGKLDNQRDSGHGGGGGGGGSPINGPIKQLNVHAKEFIMAHSPLQSSKSTGSMLHSTHDDVSRKGGLSRSNTNYPIIISRSGQNNNPNRGVQFVEEQEAPKHRDLKRSKSMSNSHHFSNPSEISITSELTLFEKHPSSALIKKACFNPDDIRSMQLMDLAKVLVDKSMDDRAHAQSYASLCVCIIEKESGGTFLESLLNLAQYTVEKKCYKDGSHRYHAFMAFLNELYSLLKSRQVHLKQHPTISPTLTVLSLIVQVCQSVLSQKNLTQRTEIECLFFTVTTVGRDIEAEDPRLLDSLMWYVRDAFLSPTTSTPIKKTLLQLVELKATKWHLPATAIMYYQSSNNC